MRLSEIRWAYELGEFFIRAKNEKKAFRAVIVQEIIEGFKEEYFRIEVEFLPSPLGTYKQIPQLMISGLRSKDIALEKLKQVPDSVAALVAE